MSVRTVVATFLLAFAAASCVIPQAAESPTPAPLASALPLPSPSTSALGIGANVDPVVAVVQDLLPSVVTVINKLSNGQPQSSGSGFIVDASRGYIVTNNHVVENVRDAGPGAAFDVVFSDNRKVDAKLVGRDQLTDLAVLQVSAQNLKAAMLGDSDTVPVGSTVVAIGSPLGEFQNTVTAGIVSAKGRRVAETQSIFLEDLVQTDAAINEGNSGGPLIWAATHQVIGVNTLVASNASGLGFAISSNTVRQIADELIKNGKVVRGFIGVQYTQLSARQAAQVGLPAGTTGIIVTQVVPGSPATQAGIRVNDIITKVNDQLIDPQHPLQSLMVKFRPGDKVKLALIRDGREQAVDVTLGQPQG
ncbi:MAG: PDZ domain-containing protein [Chloroflexi bacterium]|nr:MAG: PDZ domain-containing protein [Chloroflexota bacterium]